MLSSTALTTATHWLFLVRRNFVHSEPKDTDTSMNLSLAIILGLCLLVHTLRRLAFLSWCKRQPLLKDLPVNVMIHAIDYYSIDHLLYRLSHFPQHLILKKLLAIEIKAHDRQFLPALSCVVYAAILTTALHFKLVRAVYLPYNALLTCNSTADSLAYNDLRFRLQALFNLFCFPISIGFVLNMPWLIIQLPYTGVQALRSAVIINNITAPQQVSRYINHCDELKSWLAPRSSFNQILAGINDDDDAKRFPQYLQRILKLLLSHHSDLLYHYTNRYRNEMGKAFIYSKYVVFSLTLLHGCLPKKPQYLRPLQLGTVNSYIYFHNCQLPSILAKPLRAIMCRMLVDILKELLVQNSDIAAIAPIRSFCSLGYRYDRAFIELHQDLCSRAHVDGDAASSISRCRQPHQQYFANTR